MGNNTTTRPPGRTGLLRKWTGERGYRLAWGSPEVAEAALAELESRRDRGEFDMGFYEYSLAPFEKATPPSFTPESVIIMAIPRPAHRLVVHLSGEVFRVVFPPTYQAYRATAAAIRDELSAGLLGDRALVDILRAPLKNVAVRLGLVDYGRNNITYVEGLGSYHQLVGFVTNVRLETDGDTPGETGSSCDCSYAAEPRVSPECEGCDLCLSVCPTGALSADRFMLRAEQCLTYLNEHAETTLNLPEGFDCLIGCLICQEVCPRNEGRLRYEDLLPAFTEDETALLLAGEGDRDGLKNRLVEMGFPGYETLLARNLRALLIANGLIRAG